MKTQKQKILEILNFLSLNCGGKFVSEHQLDVWVFKKTYYDFTFSGSGQIWVKDISLSSGTITNIIPN